MGQNPNLPVESLWIGSFGPGCMLLRLYFGTQPRYRLRIASHRTQLAERNLIAKHFAQLSAASAAVVLLLAGCVHKP